MLAPAYTYRILPETFKTLNVHSTRNELKAALKELRDLAYTDIKLNVSTQEMIEKVLHLQWVHRDDNDTTVEEIESAFYADPVEQDTVELNLVEKAKKALVGLSDLEAFQVVMEKVGIGFVRNTNFDDPIWTLNVVDFELEELGKIYISFDENGKLWYAIKDLC